MKKVTYASWATAAAVMFALTGPVLADPVKEDLVINGDLKLVTMAPAPDHLKDVMDTIWSGWHFREAETRALQMDDFDNPCCFQIVRWTNGTRRMAIRANPAPAVMADPRPWRGCVPRCRGLMPRPAS